MTPPSAVPPLPVAASANAPAQPINISWLPLMLIGAGLLSVLGIARFVSAHRRLSIKLRSARDVLEDPALELFVGLLNKTGLSRRRRTPKLRAHAELRSPLATLRHHVYIPERVLVDLTPGQLEVTMAHELGHIVRRDPQWYCAAQFIEAIFAFQPLLRVARKGLHDTMEQLCDDWAVAQTGRGIDLAKSLSTVAQWQIQGRQAYPVPTMFRARGLLTQRVQHVLGEDAGTMRQEPGRAAYFSVVGLGVGLVALAPAFVSMDLAHENESSDIEHSSRHFSLSYFHQADERDGRTRERERAREEKHRDRERRHARRAQRDAERERERAHRNARRERERAHRDADRVRRDAERAQREADRLHRHAEERAREAERAREHAVQAQQHALEARLRAAENADEIAVEIESANVDSDVQVQWMMHHPHPNLVLHDVETALEGLEPELEKMGHELAQKAHRLAEKSRRLEVLEHQDCDAVDAHALHRERKQLEREIAQREAEIKKLQQKMEREGEKLTAKLEAMKERIEKQVERDVRAQTAKLQRLEKSLREAAERTQFGHG